MALDATMSDDYITLHVLIDMDLSIETLLLPFTLEKTLSLLNNYKSIKLFLKSFCRKKMLLFQQQQKIVKTFIEEKLVIKATNMDQTII